MKVDSGQSNAPSNVEKSTPEPKSQSTPKNEEMIEKGQGSSEDSDRSSVESGQNSSSESQISSKYQRAKYKNVHVDVAAKSKIGRATQIENAIARPKGSLPLKSLETWKELNPSVKLPDIRNRAVGKIYYTRGRLGQKVGQKLHRKKPDFDLGDPYNRRTVVQAKEYTALHDPHCKGYFKQPSVMEHLKKQELVNNKGEVLCNVHEFNRYRSYLSSIFDNQVRRRLSETEAVDQMKRSLKKNIHLQSRQGLSNQSKFQIQSKQKQLYAIYDAAKRRRHAAKILGWNRRIQEIERNRTEAIVAKSGEFRARHWNAYLTRKKASKLEVKRQRNSLARIAYTEGKNKYVTKYDEFVKLTLFERYKANQAAVLTARKRQIADMEQLVAETLKRSKENWVKQYGAYMERNREAPEQSYMAGKQSLYLMKKYFRRWRQIVIQNRKTEHKHHHTVFGVRNKLRPLVANLKLDNPPLGGGDVLKPSDPEADTLRLARTSKVRGSLNLSQRGSQVGKKVRISQNGRNSLKGKYAFGHRHDGHEADLDEADSLIDSVISQYALENDLLNSKLKTKSVTGTPSRQHHHAVVRNDEKQEEQTERIKFLTKL